MFSIKWLVIIKLSHIKTSVLLEDHCVLGAFHFRSGSYAPSRLKASNAVLLKRSDPYAKHSLSVALLKARRAAP